MSDYSAFAKNLATRKVFIIIIYIKNFLFFWINLTKIIILKIFMAN